MTASRGTEFYAGTTNTIKTFCVGAVYTLGPDGPPEASASTGTSAILLGVSGRGNSLLRARLTACHANTWARKGGEYRINCPFPAVLFGSDSWRLLCVGKSREQRNHAKRSTHAPTTSWVSTYYRGLEGGPHLETLLVGNEHQPPGLVHAEARRPSCGRNTRQRAVSVQIVRRQLGV